MRPCTTCSDAVTTTELGSAVVLRRDNAVPDQLRWQVRFFGHFKPLYCDGEAVPWGRNSRALIILKYWLALIPIGLITLLGVGCQEGEAANTEGGTTAEDQGATLVEETGEPSNEVKQTLHVCADMIANIQTMEAKIAIRKEAYASSGDIQGEQKLSEAANIAEDIEIQTINQAEQVQQVASTPQGTLDTALIQAKNEEIEGKAEHLENVLNEAEDCCGLEPDFLSADLQELSTQADTLENLAAQIEAEQTVPERDGREQPEQAEQEKSVPQQPKPPPAPKAEAPPAPKEVPPPPPPPGPPPPPP